MHLDSRHWCGAFVRYSVPGTLTVHGAPVQILDLPGIIEGAKDGKGRGRQVIAGEWTRAWHKERWLIVTTSPSLTVARTCNLIFIVLDVLKPLGDKAIIEQELEGFGIRLNKKPPAISIKKKDKGGIAITNTQPLTNLDQEGIKAVLQEYKMANCDVHIRCDPTLDEFIDVVEGGRVYIPAVYVLNKIGEYYSLLSARRNTAEANWYSQMLSRLRNSISFTEFPTLYPFQRKIGSTLMKWSRSVLTHYTRFIHGEADSILEEQLMWEKLDLVRIYTKPKGRQPDYTAPVVLKHAHCTVEDFCNSIHK